MQGHTNFRVKLIFATYALKNGCSAHFGIENCFISQDLYSTDLMYRYRKTSMRLTLRMFISFPNESRKWIWH